MKPTETLFQDITPTECGEYFLTLDQLLQATPLPTGTTAEPMRTAACHEFMIMGTKVTDKTPAKKSGLVVMFKHITSRNYLALDYSNRLIFFKVTDCAFNHGTFPQA